MTAAQAESFFGPYFDILRRVVREAWDDWKTNPLAPQVQHKRVRASCVWNQFIAGAKRAFSEDSNVRVETMREWEGLLFHNKVFVRFKKASKALLSRNYPTPLALAYHDQQNDLFGSGVKRLELVYVLDESETELERICLVQRHREYIAWHLDLLGGGDDRQEVLPFAPQAPAGPSVAKRVLKSKRSKENGGGKHGTGGGA
ncbi:MAG TPA: hypothetical protein VFE82_13040 [Ramlibacter sp.]|uniref:hypothetical protein n=1 Tax=Ramlibacter sp. TaxID=1917967 RepID=UPI002D584839|nr:hypothetical protein [Ramlibacter sp.]HZY19401.1 hypothetical protein [Ramlibacter sp.]